MCPAGSVSGHSHAWTHQPLSVPPSPEKEAFKKRQKLQQDNGEETDENEVEEVSLHMEHWNWHTWDRDQAQPGPGAVWKGCLAEDSMLEQGEAGYSPVSLAVERGAHIFGGLVSISIGGEGSGC